LWRVFVGLYGTLNAFAFDGGTWTLQDTTNQITVLHGIITTDSPAATTTSSPREVSWFAPPDNAFKLNVAGAHLASNPGPSGFWGLLRNNSAEWITGFSGYCGHATNLYAELMTILQGLLLVWEKGIRLLICESDSSWVLHLIDHGDNRYHPYAAVINKTRDWVISFSHTLRQGNMCADSLPKMGSSTMDTLTIWDECPQQLSSLLLGDSLGVTYVRQ